MTLERWVMFVSIIVSVVTSFVTIRKLYFEATATRQASRNTDVTTVVQGFEKLNSQLFARIEDVRKEQAEAVNQLVAAHKDELHELQQEHEIAIQQVRLDCDRQIESVTRKLRETESELARVGAENHALQGAFQKQAVTVAQQTQQIQDLQQRLGKYEQQSTN